MPLWLRLLLVRACPRGRERHAGPGAGDRDQVHQCLLLRHGARHRLHRAAPRGQVGVDQRARGSPTCSSRKATRSPKIRNSRASPRRRAAARRPGGRQADLARPAAGLVTEVRTAVGAPASPQAGPMFRISVNNEIELEAEVPSVHLLKLNRVLRCASAVTTRPMSSARSGRYRRRSIVHRSSARSWISRTTILRQDRHVCPRQYRRQALLLRRSRAPPIGRPRTQVVKSNIIGRAGVPS